MTRPPGATARPSPGARTPTPPPSPTSAVAATTATWRQAGADLAALSLSGAVFDGSTVRLARGSAGFVAAGQAISPVRESAFAFDTAVLSWNADAPPGASIKLELRARTAAGWSAWYTLGTWGSAGGASVAGQSDATARVDVDTLELRAPAQALQYRATLATSNPATTPALRLVAVAYSDLSRPPAGPALPRGVGWGRELDVPRLSQLDQDPSLMWSVCSPTSLAMVLGFWGAGRSVPEAIRGARDAATGIYGNWPLNTAYAGAQGLVAWVDRFYAMEQLEAEIAAGRPVVASIRFGAGELDNAPIASATGGHLVVVRGFTAQGDVVVNDPAGQGAGVRRVYRRQQFAGVWLGQGGVVYLIRPA